jgi:hypothetical protein
MVRIRVMTVDAGVVAEVLERLLSLPQASPYLVVGDRTELGMRGPGRRVVFELIPTTPPVDVRVERADPPPARRPARRALGR